MNVTLAKTQVAASYRSTEKEVGTRQASENAKQKADKSQKQDKQQVKVQQEQAVIYEPSSQVEQKVTYSKAQISIKVPEKAAAADLVTEENKQEVATVKPDLVTIERLREESEQAYSQLRELVERLLLKQGYSFEQLLNNEIADADFSSIEVDEATQAEAAALIADDGPLGAEAVSDRIVEFAKAISGGDISKLGMLRAAIEQGFTEAKQMLGDYLPDVSIRTQELVSQKLDAWQEEIKASSAQ